MAQNSAYYPQQQQSQQQYTQVYPQAQPQNIYQQLGKPQPQPHLQEHPIYRQSLALVVQPQGGYPFSQQLPAQVQTSFPLAKALHVPPRTSYQLEKPHVSPQTPYPQSQTPYLPSQPPYAQSQTSYSVSQQQLYTSSQTPYQQSQRPGQQQSHQAYSSSSQLQVSYIPQTSFASQTPAVVPTNSSGSSWRAPASWPPPVAPSATLAQQARPQIQTQVQPQAASQNLALTPAQRSLPQPLTVANATILPFNSPPAAFPSPESTAVPSSNSSSSKRGRPLPIPTGTTDKQATIDLGRLSHMFSNSLAISAFTQSSISSQPLPQPIITKCTSSPSKRPLPEPSSYSPIKSEWNKFSGLPAAVTIIPKSISTTTSSSISPTSATTSNSTLDISSHPQPQSQLIPANRTPPSLRKGSLPAPSSHNPVKKSEWNKFSGLPVASTIPKSILTTTSSSISAPNTTSTSVASEPPPKKSTPIWKQTIPDHPAPAWGYAVGMVSEPYPKPKAKVPTPGSTSFKQSGVQKRYTYQQQPQAYNGHARSPATHGENRDEDEEDEEDSEEETDSDEEDEEQLDPRYNHQNRRQKYTRPMASKLITSRAGVRSHSLSRVYGQNIKGEMTFMPKRKLRLKPKVKMNKMDPCTAYKDVNTTNGHKIRIVPRRGRHDIPMLEEGSNDESEYEHHQQPNRRRVRVPRINVASNPSSSRPPPRIQVNGSGPSIPSINLNSSPRMNRTINYDSGHIVNIEPPTTNVDVGDSPRGGGVSGPAARNFHSYHHAQLVSQQPQFRKRRRPKRQARPTAGLICGGCNGSIIGRIVSAMGSRWHPACFRCTVCNEPLEHVSSYEHEGRPYCHLDYHENFAPRCYSCKTAIIDEQFISLDDPALGKRTYHTEHFFCAECGDLFLVPSVLFPDSIGEVVLSGDGEFEGFTVYKGHPYCEACHVRLRLPKCKRCKRSIRDHDEAVEALGGKWCWGCFVCATCKEPFENPSFFQRGDRPFCEPCFSIMLSNEV